MNKSASVIIAFFVVVSLIAPFGAIWSLNTLFGLGIDYNLKTWLAMYILAWLTGVYKVESKK